MTNEELVVRIQAGETDLILTLWEQVKLYAYKRVNAFYYSHYDRCAEMGVNLEDLQQEAFIGIHKAVEKYKVEKGVKFLTYAEYRLQAGFNIAAKLHNGGHRYHEAKLEDITICENRGGEAITLSDTLTDPHAEYEMQDFIEQEAEREYQSQLGEAIQNAFNRLSNCQKETAIACLRFGLTPTEYARQTGVTRQSAQLTLSRALQKLKVNSELAAYAV